MACERPAPKVSIFRLKKAPRLSPFENAVCNKGVHSIRIQPPIMLSLSTMVSIPYTPCQAHFSKAGLSRFWFLDKTLPAYATLPEPQETHFNEMAHLDLARKRQFVLRIRAAGNIRIARALCQYKRILGVDSACDSFFARGTL